MCGFVATWPLPPFPLNASHWLDICNLFGRGFVPCVPLCPAFLGRVFVRFACLKTRVLAWCLRRPCRLALSAGRLSASARFCAKQNILCFLRVGLLSGVCCCVLTAKILSFICTKSRPLTFQFSGNRFFSWPPVGLLARRAVAPIGFPIDPGRSPRWRTEPPSRQPCWLRFFILILFFFEPA